MSTTLWYITMSIKSSSSGEQLTTCVAFVHSVYCLNTETLLFQRNTMQGLEDEASHGSQDIWSPPPPSILSLPPAMWFCCLMGSGTLQARPWTTEFNIIRNSQFLCWGWCSVDHKNGPTMRRTRRGNISALEWSGQTDRLVLSLTPQCCKILISISNGLKLNNCLLDYEEINKCS